MFRSLATQQTKLEYFQDFQSSLGDTTKVVESPSGGLQTVRITPAPLVDVEKGVEGGILRQRGPRQKFRSSSTAADLPLSSQRTAKVDDSTPRTVVSVTTQRLQRCIAYCTAESYNFDQLLQSLQKNRIPSLYFNEVIHVSLPRTPSSTDEYDGQEGDIFYFKDGCVVFWDIPQPQVVALLAELASFEVSPYDRRTVFENYSEEMGFHYGKHAGLMPTGELVLSIGQQNWAKTQVLEKIAFSYGVQRSVKMSVIESIADDLIVSLKHIPDILMDKRALKMDQKGVMKKMGQLLAVRGLINLHLPLSETPEAYWEEPWLEELYSKISRELDLANRIRSLNRRLDYAHQVVEVLRTDLSEKHSTRLEQIIIGLISIEVLFEMVHFFI